MDGYLENAMDYVLETFESANEWMKENDPLKFPMVQAACFDPKGCITITWGSGDGDIGGSTLPSIMSSGGSSNSFSSSGNGNGIGQGSGFNAKGFESLSNPPSTNDLQIVKPLEIPKYEDYAPHPGVEIERQFKEMDRIINGNMGPQVAQNTNTDSGSGGSGTSEQGTNSGDNAQNSGNSGENERGEGKQQEKKQCVTTNQKLVFANAAYYNEDEIEKNGLLKGNEKEEPLVMGTYKNDRLGSKLVIISPLGDYGVDVFNIAGTANPMEEGLENYMRDSINNVLIGTNSLQGILKDRVDWYISRIEEYNKVTRNNEPLILNGHSSGGFEALIIAALRPDLVSQVNMVDSPGGYDMVLKLMNGDIAKANEVYKKVEIYNGNRNFVNSKGSHPPGKVIHHINSDEHQIKKIMSKYSDYGHTEILGRCHADNLCNYKNGEYTVERFKDDVTKKEIADYFGLSEGQIEAINNKELSAEDLAKFENRISSKFKFKVAHERSQEEQCVY